MAKKNTLRCGVIGLGVGRMHLDGYAKAPDAVIAAIADPNEERLKEFGAKYNLSALYTSAEEMLEKEGLDVVSIATPNSLHMPLTIAALESGAHVLCEKPMAMNTAEAEEMLAASRKANRRLMINFSYRFTPAAWGLKQQVESGILGEVYGARTRWMRRDGFPGFGGWFGTKALSGGGPLIDLGVHRIDLALWLAGYAKPKFILANVHSHLGSERASQQGNTFDVEDYAAAIVTFENGMTLQIENSWAAHIQHAEDMETSLFGTKGGLCQRNLSGKYDFEGKIFTMLNGCSVDIEVKDGSAPASSMAHFVRAILRDEPHIATAEEGLVIMRILDGIYASAAAGGEPVSL